MSDCQWPYRGGRVALQHASVASNAAQPAAAAADTPVSDKNVSPRKIRPGKDNHEIDIPPPY